MTYPSQATGLTLDILREANAHRLPQFRDRHGNLAHSEPDGSDWSPAEWLQAVVGELGEFANLAKKVRRGDYTLDEKRHDLGEELADVIIYLDILAAQYGIDLSQSVIAKFNKVSKRVKASTRISPTGQSIYQEESTARPTPR